MFRFFLFYKKVISERNTDDTDKTDFRGLLSVIIRVPFFVRSIGNLLNKQPVFLSKSHLKCSILSPNKYQHPYQKDQTVYSVLQQSFVSK